MHRATLGDLCKALALRFIEIAFDMNVACDFFNISPIRYVTIFAVVSVNALEIIGSAYRFKRESLILAVPGDCHASTGGKGTQKQFIGIWPGVGATGLQGFVGIPLVPPVGQLYGHA